MAVIDLAANPTSGSSSYVNFGGLKSNSYNPATQSSYPRGRAAHGFFFYVPNSGNYDLWAVNLSNGAWHKFETGSSQQWYLANNKGNFVVSIDSTVDKMYLYANANNDTQLLQWVYDGWSSIEAIDSAALQTHNASSETITNNHTTAGGNHHMSSNMAKSNMGYDASGGFYYKNTSHERVHVDKNFNIVGTNVASITANGSTLNNPNQAFVAKEDKLTQAQDSALSLTAPTFGIQLLGVKSTV